MQKNIFYGILLIIGTSIGAGLLALPIATAKADFISATILLLACWLIMTTGAFCILEVNLWFSKDSNLVSMAKKTLGHSGKLIIWFVYLLLFYSLLAAYISGGSDVLYGILATYHIKISSLLTTIIFTVIFGVIVYLGIRSVDYMMRCLMSVKMLVFILMILIIFRHVNANTLLVNGHTRYILSALMVVVTSFGFAIIVPSLRVYYQDDVKKLIRLIAYGSLIPLVFYLCWILVVRGALNYNTLLLSVNNPQPTTFLTQSIILVIKNNWFVLLANIFTSICMVTSFLGVALSMTHFIADGFKLSKSNFSRSISFVITFCPPLLLTLLNPAIFIASLNYAGIFCIILLALMPGLMLWYGRYKKNLRGPFRLFGGKITIIIQIFISILVLLIAILQYAHVL